MEKIQMQTTFVCHENELSFLIERCVSLLAYFDAVNEEVKRWQKTFRWPLWEDGLNPFEFPTISLRMGEEHVTATLLFLFFPSEKGERFQENLGIEFVFEAEQIQDEETLMYKKRYTALLWHLMKKFSFMFPVHGIYLTNEEQDGKALRAEKRGDGVFWSFDLALVPATIFQQFLPLPDDFMAFSFDGKYGLARKERWDILPWFGDD